MAEHSPVDARYEYRIEHDTNVLNGSALARIKYRPEGVRNWRKFVVVLDDWMTYETVAQNAEAIISRFERGSS